LNVQLFGITDNLPFSQKAFADSLQLPYPLLSDMKLDVTKAYGVMDGGKWRRSFFLVDKEGIVRGRWIGEDSGVFPNEPLLKAAEEIAGKPAEDAGGKKASGM
jgi:glutaredoxin-dependent peroxiredoxin